MLLIWFVLSIVAVITKTASNTIEENRCDLSPRCMNDSLSLPIKRSTALRCTKRTPCSPLDNNLVAVNQINKIDIHLKDIQIKQKKNGYQVQVILSSYDDLIKQGNQSLLVKFSFGRDTACYQFLIPFSVLMNYKDILLSCFRIPILQKDHLEILFFVHKENDEVISIQAMDYSLSNVAVGQWLGGSQFRITYDLDHEFIYFSLNVTQDSKCLFHYSISVYKSHQNHPCSIKQTPVYRWTDTLNSPYHKLNMSQKLLSSSQIYCIYAIFSKFQQCGTLQAKYFYYISFFQLVPPLCEKWNFSIDVKTNKKDLIATMTLWKQYPSCFSSYCMYLYEFNSPSCDTDYGRLMPSKFKFEARPNKTVIFNSPICGKHGHLLLLGKFNFEARPNKTEVVFKNVTIGYYCIVVVPFSVDGSAIYDWTRHSRPIIVTETSVNNIELNKDENTEFGTKVIVAISFLLFFTTFALWSCSAHIRRSKAKTNKVFSDEKDGKENMPLLALPVDKVFLFHSHDDNSIKNDVSGLKNFLKDGAPFSVITLSDVLPEIVEQPSRTVSNILECGCSGMGPSCASNKKFIIVISEKVLRNIDDDNLIWRSLEERAFHMVLDFITANWREAYCHLFLVAFNESIFEDRRFENMALKNVGAHYTIPDRLERLCLKLGFSSSRHMRREELPMCPER